VATPAWGGLCVAGLPAHFIRLLLYGDAARRRYN
jgi:hypothetical protein